MAIMATVKQMKFQSTLLMRGATDNKDADCDGFRFQSTLLMRGAT